MIIQFSARLMDDLTRSVHAAIVERGIVNIPVLAEEVRKRNEFENIALEDIERMVMRVAQSFNAAMELDGFRSVSEGDQAMERPIIAPRPTIQDLQIAGWGASQARTSGLAGQMDDSRSESEMLLSVQ